MFRDADPARGCRGCVLCCLCCAGLCTSPPWPTRRRCVLLPARPCAPVRVWFVGGPHLSRQHGSMMACSQRKNSPHQADEERERGRENEKRESRVYVRRTAHRRAPPSLPALLFRTACVQPPQLIRPVLRWPRRTVIRPCRHGGRVRTCLRCRRAAAAASDAASGDASAAGASAEPAGGGQAAVPAAGQI